MRTLAVIDSETDPFQFGAVPVPFLWGCLSRGDRYRRFDSTAELVAYLRDKDWLVYAHNGGKFDFHFLFDYIEPSEILVINNRLVKCRLGRCELRDSWSIVPTKVGNVDKDEVDYAIFTSAERDKPENREIIERYLRKDCETLLDMVESFSREHGSAITLATGAMRKLVKLCELKAPKTTRGYFEAIQPFYFGGRVSTFQRGRIKGPVHLSDIRSAYPAAMRLNHPYGGALHLHRGNPTPGEFLDQGLYLVSAISRGAFPRRAKDGSLDFPTSKTAETFYVTGWEINTAQRLNLAEVKEVEQSYLPAEMANFSPFVDHYYAKKDTFAKGTADYWTSKLTLNSPYGKMASNPTRYMSHQIATPAQAGMLIEEGWQLVGEFGPNFLMGRPLEDDEMRFYDVATAASITGRVRSVLLEGTTKVEGVVYCDTDSLLNVGSRSLDYGRGIGQWDYEGEWAEAAIIGKKLYALVGGRVKTGSTCPRYCGVDRAGAKCRDPYWCAGAKVASKGVRLTAREIFDLAEGKEITYRSAAPTFSLGRDPGFLTRRVKMRA